MNSKLEATKFLESSQEGNIRITKTEIKEIKDQSKIRNILVDVGDRTQFEDVVFEDNSGHLHCDIDILIEWLQERYDEESDEDEEHSYSQKEIDSLNEYKGFWISEVFVKDEA